MSTPIPAVQETVASTLAPSGVRIASTLCWVVGVVTVLAAVAVGVPALSQPDSDILSFTVNVAVGLAVCVAAVLIRRQRRVGVLVLVLAWATPTVITLLQKQTPRGGPLLVVVALLLAGANWKHLC